MKKTISLESHPPSHSPKHWDKYRGGDIMVILRKHYTCFNCGERYKRDTSEIVIDAKEKIKCPNCGGYPMSLASVEQLPNRDCFTVSTGAGE